MATAFLSRHSSNPLEVSSSDVRNRKLLRQYIRAKAVRADDASEDPLAVQGEADGYRTQRHQSQGVERRTGLVDLESDDELMKDEGEEDNETAVLPAQQEEGNDEGAVEQEQM
jgi:cell division control protein 7